jgi:DUF1365 family protein
MGEPLQSGLYECRVMHARFAPQSHRFSYRIFLMAVDLDEVASLPRRVGLFSFNQRNVYSFRDRDYLPIDEPVYPAPTAIEAAAIGSTAPSLAAAAVTATSALTESALPQAASSQSSASLKSRVLALAAKHGTDLTDGRVILLTLPRVFGYLFNPVSFYFCYDRQGEPAAVIAEVTNTFREVKPYFLGAPARDPRTGAFRLRVPKHFYVSPFSDVDVAFDFNLRMPGEHLALQIDDYTEGARTLTTTLTGERQELTTARLAWYTLKYPLITVRVIALIHWHALRLWIKRVPWFAKAARAGDQRDLHRPHHSLAHQSPTLSAAHASSDRVSASASLQPSDVA